MGVCWSKPPVEVQQPQQQAYAYSARPVSHIMGTLKGQITVRTLTGKAINLDVDFRETVSIVKYRIQSILGIPAHQQALMCLGRQLPDTWTLADCQVSHGALLYLVVRLV